MENKLFELYTLAELSYQKHFKGIEDLYPIGWYEIKDYKEKINIIADAINQNKLIKDIESYKNLVLSKKYIKKKTN